MKGKTMSPGRIALFGLAVLLALGGVAALADRSSEMTVAPVGANDTDDDGVLRRDDAADEIVAVDDDDDGPTGDGDNTRGNDGTGGGDNTGDGDNTGGNDGTGGGDNTGDDNTRTNGDTGDTGSGDDNTG